jgi:hypothetical protein
MLGFMPSPLLDRMYAAMLESNGAWPATRLAVEFLKLRGSGPSPEPLIRGLLARDSRFIETHPGSWSAVVIARPPLDRGAYVLAWVETGSGNTPETWRLHLRPHASVLRLEALVKPAAAVTLLPQDADAWGEIRRRWEGARLATLQPGLMNRWLQWIERCWAFPEWEPPPLDLQSWVRVALVREGASPAETAKLARLPEILARWRLGPLADDPPGVPLPALEALLDRLLHEHGSWSESDLLQAWKDAFSARPVPWERFAFGPSEVEATPDESGIYRFYDREDRLLYVGKAVRLARRLGSYFRALPPEPSKREELLGQIHRFEVTPLPSELEAVVRESRAIRRQRPPWNVQVEVRRPERFPPDWWWPLVFLAPGTDPLRASVFLAEGPDQGFLFHLPRQGSVEDLTSLAAWLDGRREAAGPGAAFPEGLGAGPDPESGPAPDPGRIAPDPERIGTLDPPEVWLVLRSYLRLRDGYDRVDSIHFTSGAALLEALLTLAGAREAAEIALDHRPVRLSASDFP